MTFFGDWGEDGFVLLEVAVEALCVRRWSLMLRCARFGDKYGK